MALREYDLGAIRVRARRWFSPASRLQPRWRGATVHIDKCSLRCSNVRHRRSRLSRNVQGISTEPAPKPEPPAASNIRIVARTLDPRRHQFQTGHACKMKGEVESRISAQQACEHPNTPCKALLRSAEEHPLPRQSLALC